MAVTQIDSNNLQPTFQLGHPTITNVQVTNSSYVVVDDTAVSTSGGYIKITGSMFNSGVQVYIGSILATSISIVSSTVLNVQVPATAAGTYDVMVVNTNGTYCIKPIGITFSPINITWVTPSSLGGYQTGVAISLQLSATGATGYQLQSGSTLPTGLTLTSGGLLSGTVTVVSDTTYSFTIEAYDSELQDAPRTFSLSVLLNSPLFSAEYLVVAAGGGQAGDTHNGGAGAGGLLTNTIALTVGVLYTITVGAGGTGQSYGSNSSISGFMFSTVTALGGGFGSGTTIPLSSTGGGSGGGATLYNGSQPGTGTPGQGNNGGTSGGYPGRGDGSGGGGGGAGQVGYTGNSGDTALSGRGGDGLPSSITGTSTYYAGGGGGARWLNSIIGTTTGGLGGGGNGGRQSSAVLLAQNGTSNTGGGSGARYLQSTTGGSGVVIIRYSDTYPAATSTTGSPTITVAGGYRVYQFTGSGSITF